jgi:hypothetical protein
MSGPPTPFDGFEIEQAIRCRAAEVVFAAPRVVRRIIRADRDLPLSFARLPHRDIAVIESRRLAALAEDFWAFPPELAATVAVVARPDAGRFSGAERPALLREYWRLVFHALLDLSVAPAIDREPEGRGWHRVMSWIGSTQFAEATAVLVQEGYLAPDPDDRLAAAEFIAVFLEFRVFRPDDVRVWFPSLDDPDELAERLSGLVDAEQTLERAIPPMLDPDASIPPSARTSAASRSQPMVAWPAWLRTRPAALRRRADRTALRGNFVRASLDEWQATVRPLATGPTSTARLDRQVDAFARRLGWALDLDAASVDDATVLIRELVEQAKGSSWAPQARLLYDLQKICVDSERESFRTELLRWLISFGRRPLATPLPCQRLVLIHRHAVAAASRIPSLGFPSSMRRRADRLMAAAVATTDAAAREPLRPRVETAMRVAGLVPACLVEEAAFEKLVDELLDAIMQRGFVSFGSVRDAVSRNELKLPDLRGLGEWLGGDPLLRVDARLAASLDGVYRPAPAYLSLMQRLSAPAFGTSAGRLLTTHVLVPFGGAWLLLRGLEHVIEPLSEYSFGEMWHVYTRSRMVAIGLAAWALIHLPRVRSAALQAARGAAAVAHFLVVTLPDRLLKQPLVERLLRSAPVRWLVRHAVGPLLVTLIFWLLLPHRGRGLSRNTPWLLPAVFAGNAVFLNSRLGRQLQERGVEAIGRAIHQFHLHVIVGLLSWIVDGFRRAMDFVEGTLYAVDESLRFRSDESGLILALKAVLGAIWSVIDAVTRFCITLLIEPQLNPIKHFPVVTVSHKLLVPMIPMVTSQLTAATGMEKGVALTAVTFVSTCIPGVFGFLAWELKENWRLYAANRPRVLRPVQVGSHGETVRRLLTPGFHSGTIPRLFARLRRIHGRSAADPTAEPTTRIDHRLHELERDVAVFVERDVFALLDRTATAAGLDLRVHAVRLAVNRISIEMAAEAIESGPLIINLIQREGTIESWVVDPGWVAGLSGDRRRAVHLAVAGFHRLAAADRATAAFASLPGGSPAFGDLAGSVTSDVAATEVGGSLVTLEPIDWEAWRVAWERERRP